MYKSRSRVDTFSTAIQTDGWVCKGTAGKASRVAQQIIVKRIVLEAN
jgi:hypothetical protein